MSIPKLNQVSDFDIKLLKIFKVICDYESFSIAESVLGISSSAISIYMNDLEKRLGIKLCQRGRAGFALTHEGKEILKSIEVLFAAIEHFRLNVNQIHGEIKGELNIGIINNLVTMPSNLITNTLKKLANNPHIVINISMSTQSDIEARVLDGRLHIGVVPQHKALTNLEYIHLYKEYAYLYCGQHHTFFLEKDFNQIKQEDISAEQLKKIKKNQIIIPNDIVSTDIMKLHKKFQSTATASDREGVAFLILTGQYIAFLPNHFAKKWVDEGLMKPILKNIMRYETSICLITKKNHQNMLTEHFLHTLLLENDLSGRKAQLE